MKLTLELTTEQAELLFDVLDDAADSAMDTKRDLDTDEERTDVDAYIDDCRKLQIELRRLMGKDISKLSDGC